MFRITWDEEPRPVSNTGPAPPPLEVMAALKPQPHTRPGWQEQLASHGPPGLPVSAMLRERGEDGSSSPT